MTRRHLQKTPRLPLAPSPPVFFSVYYSLPTSSSVMNVLSEMHDAEGSVGEFEVGMRSHFGQHARRLDHRFQHPHECSLHRGRVEKRQTEKGGRARVSCFLFILLFVTSFFSRVIYSKIFQFFPPGVVAYEFEKFFSSSDFVGFSFFYFIDFKDIYFRVFASSSSSFFFIPLRR